MNQKFFLIIFLFFLLFSCKTTDRKSGFYFMNKPGKYDEVFKSNNKYMINKFSKIPETQFIIKSDSKGKIWGELSSPLLYRGRFIGEVYKNENTIEFNIENFYYFASWHNGWTEGKNEAYGKLIFTNENNKWKCSVEEPFELFDISMGQIRYMDQYYRNENGLSKVKNRIERIKAVIAFLKENLSQDYFGHVLLDLEYGKSFKNTVQPFLFPETVMKNKRPANYAQIKYNNEPGETVAADSTDDSKTVSEMQQETKELKWSLGNGILWNNYYTKKIFPEHLHKLRNTGSMWRDYEESKQLMFMFYNLDYYYNHILNDSVFLINK